MLYSFFEKPISTSMLRHIFLTDKYKNVPALTDMMDTASHMGHDVSMALKYIKKVPSPEKN
jgi:hypothetical protein